MNVRRRTTVIAVAMLGSGALGACTGSGGGNEGSGGEGGVTTLQYAFFGPAGSHAGQQMEEWATLVEERTEGRVEVETFPGGTLLGAGDIYDGVTEGVVDVGLDSPHNDASRFPLSSVLTVPLGIPDGRVGSAVYYDLIEEFEPTEFDGYHVVTAFTAEPSFIQSVSTIESYTDMAGAEMRVSGATVPLAEALGYVPVGMPIPEVAEALQTNVVDGYISSRDVLRDFGLAESISTVIEYPFGLAGTFVAVMDQEDFDALSDQDQAVIDELSAEMSQFAAAYQDDESVAGAIEHAETEYDVQFIEPTEEDAAAFDEITSQVQQEWVEAHAGADFDAQAVLDRALELVAEHSAQQ
ncbi:TRAP transporter substrate-binding protein [Georgenia sp. Z1344]|uniref:TRAP transporter substrate-binding protein n=1 Tax=Georgenia sp. Z1344 TaxID=3416706 RepID=UPI003CEA48F0